MAVYMRNYDRGVPAMWTSWLNLLLGLWVIIAPFVVAFSGSPTAVWNDVIVGALIAIAGLVAAQSMSPAASWWNVAFGVWLFFSPWILQFGAIRDAVTNNLICGAAVVILGLIGAFSRSTSVSRPMGTNAGV
jgi:hypothetical protein